MKIETLNALLQVKHPGARATVNGRGGAGRIACAISLTYTPGGKVYEYRNTILGLAEQLGLIPLIDCNVVAREVIGKLAKGEQVTASINAVDTIRYHAPWPIGWEPIGEDQYGRRLARYWVV